MPRRQGRAKGSRLDAHAAFLEGLIEERKDATLAEMAATLKAKRDVVISESALCRWLRHRGWRYKKVRTRERAGAPGRP